VVGDWSSDVCSSDLFDSAEALAVQMKKDVENVRRLATGAGAA